MNHERPSTGVKNFLSLHRGEPLPQWDVILRDKFLLDRSSQDVVKEVNTHCMHIVILFTLLCIVYVVYAQQCLEHPCGKLKCTRIACRISPEDCAPGESYLYPGLICECCGSCVNRTVGVGSECRTKIMNTHASGCEEGLCCSQEGKCVQKTSEFGA
ncbi:hypothetical protein C0J52_12814 [Blattella germanica]|nr:hypothetical protein C0J52_12814 [Blattella germanica]